MDSYAFREFEENVLKHTTGLPDGVNVFIKGYDFNNGIDYDALFSSYSSMGIQATNLNRAEDIINKMVS